MCHEIRINNTDCFGILFGAVVANRGRRDSIEFDQKLKFEWKNILKIIQNVELIGGFKKIELPGILLSLSYLESEKTFLGKF